MAKIKVGSEVKYFPKKKMFSKLTDEEAYLNGRTGIVDSLRYRGFSKSYLVIFRFSTMVEGRTTARVVVEKECCLRELKLVDSDTN